MLRFPSATGGTGAQDYGRFTRELSPDELAGCFFFTDDDRRRIATRRGDASRLGFAVQLGTVRYLGRFLEDPAEVPASVLDWTIREIGVPAATTLAGYGDGEARWEHQAEIRRAYGYRPFGVQGVEDELALWLGARAWISAESHRVLFTRAAEHLTARRILLPGYSTLWRLVGHACEHADARGFAMLADTPTGEQRDRLAELLQPRRAVACPCSSGCGAPRSSRRSAAWSTASRAYMSCGSSPTASAAWTRCQSRGYAR